MSVAIGIIVGCLWVVFEVCFSLRRSKTKNYVVRIVPKSNPPRAIVEAGGQVFEFPVKKGES